MEKKASCDRQVILDERGVVQEWLRDGRGVAVWRSQEIGVNRPDVFTPGDKTKTPHWAYRLDRVITSADDCLFYRPGFIVKSWKDTVQGCKAAQRSLDAMPDEVRTAPIGKVYTTYTLHRYAMQSVIIRPESEGGTVLETYSNGGGHASPVDVEFRIGIRMWSAIEQADEEAN